ncbi:MULTISPECIES: GGDEF domain-containing protein [Enterobacteriaceae]|jgi:diguanylate cyclase (GGDEF)-like protein/PAS domain S-box-containing protein|uniref:GGDEF domain-containing protein n=1 Tax=Enterobacteriaceae TaxID=543 RepID=UPI00118404C5|nr:MULTISPECIES: sensor domain-containing diguanylate cyclase [Enterobacteriaceae]TSJ50838.1 sensor domain-containing diguanylate cyclase [Atlantibacter subterranea]
MNDGKRQSDLPDVDEKHLLDLLHHNSDWVWEVDAQGRYTWVSGVVHDLLGYEPGYVIGRTPFDFMPPGEAERVAGAFGEIVSQQRAFSGLVNRNMRADGQIVVLETSGIPLFNDRGELTGYRGIDRNISNLGERVLQLETIYDTTPVALCMLDLDGRLVMSNKAMNGLLNISPEEAAGSLLGHLMPDVWQQFQDDFFLAESGVIIPGREIIWRDRCYDTQPVALYNASNRVVGLSVTWVDITARREAEQKLASANQVLQQYAQRDHLTGLYNRRYMDERLMNEINQAVEDGFPLSVCLADIDYFKRYNDNYGHQSGDNCLRAVAKALVSSRRRPEDNVSRYGGEEFLVILPRTDQAQALAEAERLRENINALMLPHVASPTHYLTISIGVATLYACESLSPDTPLHMIASGLIHQADTALYAAKNRGRNQVVAMPENAS